MFTKGRALTMLDLDTLPQNIASQTLEMHVLTGTHGQKLLD